MDGIARLRSGFFVLTDTKLFRNMVTSSTKTRTDRMTRVNCIDPAMLTNEHLGAAWTETPRIITEVERLIQKGVAYPDYADQIPEQYVFGEGHNKFFYNKLTWVVKYLDRVHQVGRARGYNYKAQLLDSFHERVYLIGVTHDVRWCRDWQPSQEDIYLNMARLVENHFKPGIHVDGREVWNV